MRRLDRGGESEYLMNRARVRRLDVLELLSDTGLGREMHSVIGQGKVEEILLSKPHERRRFVEEAAGLGQVPAPPRPGRVEAGPRRVRARARPRPRARGARARLRPLAIQATAAERAAKLGAEIAAGRIALLTSDAAGRGRARGRATGAGSRPPRPTGHGAEGRLAELAARRAKAEAELTGLATAQERAGACVLRLRDGPRAARARRRRAGAGQELARSARRPGAGLWRSGCARTSRGSRASAIRLRQRPRARHSRRAGSPRPTPAKPPRLPRRPRLRWER